jgi:SAM-dependent methyltransferase
MRIRHRLARYKNSLRRHLFEIRRSIGYALRPASRLDNRRYAYQQLYIRHHFEPGERILDIGSGGDPFPYATVIADRYLEPTHHRAAAFQRGAKPTVVCDVEHLPFQDKALDYVVCSHVLEHIDDPLRACTELQRVSKAGFIETPTLMKDALFAWAKGMHRWHILSMKDHLFFFEYDDRRAEGIRGRAWRDLILEQHGYHPLQEAFNGNQDLFNTMLEWQDTFRVTVIHMDGSIYTTAEVRATTYETVVQ